MATADSVKQKISSLIAKANAKTGATDATLSPAVDRLISGYGQGGGITPTGTKSIIANGEYPVSEYERVNVAVPTGLNAKVFTATVASDVTSGNLTIFPANDYLKSIRSDPNAFLLIIPLNQQPSTAMYSLWFNANFTIAYTGATARKTILIRTTASAQNVTLNNNGLPGANYSGHASVESDGSIMIRGCNTTYPVRAGDYLIIAGLKEML